MKKLQKTPQWIVAKRARKAAKRQGKSVVRAHTTPRIKWSH